MFGFTSRMISLLKKRWVFSSSGVGAGPVFSHRKSLPGHRFDLRASGRATRAGTDTNA